MSQDRWKDPTREEMLSFLLGIPDSYDDLKGREFDAEEAIYWYAAMHHGGQGSNLYKALCASKYRPGAAMKGPEDVLMYNRLVDAFGGIYGDLERDIRREF